MEYIEGDNLRAILKQQGCLSVEAVGRLGRELADALTHVHNAEIVHRDLKPSNIIMRPNGQSVLTDFGISFAATLPKITQGVLGTPEYMSPEQVEAKELDGRCDIYGLGIVLYECLVGNVPFQSKGESLTLLNELIQQILTATPPLIRQHRSDVPFWLESAVMKCLEKDREARFPQARILAQTLRENAFNKKVIAAHDELPVEQPVSGTNKDEHLEHPRPPSTGTQAVEYQPDAPPVTHQIGHQRRRSWLPVLLIAILVLAGIAYVTIQSKVDTGTQRPNMEHTTSPDEEAPAAVIEQPTEAPPSNRVSMPPTQTIENYYQALNNGTYETAWTMLSENFIRRYNAAGYSAYARYWSNIGILTIESVAVLKQDADRALLEVQLRYHKRRRTSTFRFAMALDQGHASWRFEDYCEIRGQPRCPREGIGGW